MKHRPIVSAALAALIVGGIAYATTTGLTGINQERFLPYEKTLRVSPNAAVLGPAAPQPDTTGTARCLAFDADNEEAFLSIEIPLEWDGTSAVHLDVDWHPEAGDPVAENETVIFLIDYYVVAYGAVMDVGTMGESSATYTGPAGGTDDAELIDTDIVLDDANQPLVAGSKLYIKFSRDKTNDTYAGDAVVCLWYLEFDADKLPTY